MKRKQQIFTHICMWYFLLRMCTDTNRENELWVGVTFFIFPEAQYRQNFYHNVQHCFGYNMVFLKLKCDNYQKVVLHANSVGVNSKSQILLCLATAFFEVQCALEKKALLIFIPVLNVEGSYDHVRGGQSEYEYILRN